MSSQLKILRTYAKMDDVAIVKLPPTVYLSHTQYTLTIFDAYPKALFHFLILPRLQISAATTNDDGNGDEGGSLSELTASESDLESLRTLLRRAAAPDSTSSSTRARAQAASMLRVLADAAARLRGEIEREMEARYGFVWDVWVGFHAVPSME